MSFSTIPDLCLLIILDRIPLQDLLTTVNLVCHRWAKLRPISSHRRKSLILYNNGDNYLDILKRKFKRNSEMLSEVVDDSGTSVDPWIWMIYQLEQHSLILPKLNCSQIFKRLMTMLPNIRSFKLGYNVNCWPEAIALVNLLLEKWSVKLVHLNLWLYNHNQGERLSANDYDPKQIDSLLHQLNQLTTLRRLTLQLDIPCCEFMHYVTNHKLSTSLSPTVLSRLDHFEYAGACSQIEDHILTYIEATLKRSSCSLQRITLKADIPLERVISQFSPRFTSKLTSYVLRLDVFDRMSDMYLVMARLSSVRTLWVDGGLDALNIPFAEFISRLSHLSQLTSLTFRIVPKSFFEPLSLEAKIEQPKMRSIKALRFTVNLPTLSHHSIEQLSIPTIFPNVQVIKFDQMMFDNLPFPACIDCGYELKDVALNCLDSHVQTMLAECARQTLKSLNKCSIETRKIYFTRSCPSPEIPIRLIQVFSGVFTPDQI